MSKNLCDLIIYWLYFEDAILDGSPWLNAPSVEEIEIIEKQAGRSLRVVELVPAVSEREKVARWLEWYDGGGLRRSEAIRNCEHLGFIRAADSRVAGR